MIISRVIVDSAQRHHSTGYLLLIDGEVKGRDKLIVSNASRRYGGYSSIDIIAIFKVIVGVLGQRDGRRAFAFFYGYFWRMRRTTISERCRRT